MGGNHTVRPDKNEFLLYAVLNVSGSTLGNPDFHFLKRKTVDHFRGYKGLDLKEKDYLHHSKPVAYVLTINEAPDFSERQGLNLSPHTILEAMRGKVMLPHLEHFYHNTDFEEFYQSIIPRYQEECEFLQGIFDMANVNDLLNDIWELDKPFDMVTIPMPLEWINSGVGPYIGDTAFQIIGPPFDYSKLPLVSHEGSHPRAKRILMPILEHIDAKKHLLALALQQPNYPESYLHWPTCFEEHFIRAMQEGFINPALGIKRNVEDMLRREEKGQGMVYIWDFYEEIKNHKDHPEGTLKDVALNILERLDKKYKI